MRVFAYHDDLGSVEEYDSMEFIDVPNDIESAKETIASLYRRCIITSSDPEWRLYKEEDGPDQNGVLQLWDNGKYTGYDVQYNSNDK